MMTPIVGAKPKESIVSGPSEEELIRMLRESDCGSLRFVVDNGDYHLTIENWTIGPMEDPFRKTFRITGTVSSSTWPDSDMAEVPFMKSVYGAYSPEHKIGWIKIQPQY